MLFSLGRGFFSYLLSYFGESLSQHVAFDLRRDFYDRVQALYTNRFFDPIRDATQQYINLQRATVAAERIFEILDTPQTVQEKPDATVLGDVRGDIEFRDVRFEYVPGIEVLHAVNLRVRPGEHVAIVGQTGAEKSTLVSLLARFYDVSGGAVLVDGHDIQDVTLQSLRRSMGSYSRIRSFFLGRCGTTSFTGVRPPLPRR